MVGEYKTVIPLVPHSVSLNITHLSFKCSWLPVVCTLCCCKVSAAGVTWLLRACTQSSGDSRKWPGVGSTLPPAHRVRPLLPQWVGGHDWSGVSAEGHWRASVRRDQNCFYFHIIPCVITYNCIRFCIRYVCLSVFYFFLGDSSADRVSEEKLIKKHMRDIMSTEDLDSLTCRMVSCI